MPSNIILNTLFGTSAEKTLVAQPATRLNLSQEAQVLPTGTPYEEQGTNLLSPNQAGIQTNKLTVLNSPELAILEDCKQEANDLNYYTTNVGQDSTDVKATKSANDSFGYDNDEEVTSGEAGFSNDSTVDKKNPNIGDYEDILKDITGADSIPDKWKYVTPGGDMAEEHEINGERSKNIPDEFYFDDFVPQSFYLESDPYTQYLETENGRVPETHIGMIRITQTMDPQISEAEKAAGVINKRRENIDHNNVFSDPHIDIYEYADGKVLKNYYSLGVLYMQEIVQYDEGVDINNLKSGDTVYTKLYEYNKDGSMLVDTRSETYSKELNGWLHTMQWSNFDHYAVDTDGETYYSLSDQTKYKEIFAREKERTYD